MIWIIFILLWIGSCIIHILWIYLEHKICIYKVGDLIDRTESFMWLPIINSVALILFGIAGMIDWLKLSVLWEKFRNIRLR